MARATCTASTARDPRRTSARPGVPGSMAAASGTSRTSVESAGSATRRAMRRLTFARRSAPIAPAGRWVASTRCTPSARPCAASRANAADASGTSSVSARSSSTTTSRRDGVVGCVRVELGDVAGAGGHQQPLAAAQLGAEPAQHAVRVRGVEVRDVLEDVRQARDGAQTGPALEVDQEDGQPLRRMGQGERQDDRREQLGLARPRGPGDECVRPVRHEIDGHRPTAGTVAQRDDQPGPRPVPGGCDGTGRGRGDPAVRAEGRLRGEVGCRCRGRNAPPRPCGSGPRPSGCSRHVAGPSTRHRAGRAPARTCGTPRSGTGTTPGRRPRSPPEGPHAAQEVPRTASARVRLDRARRRRRPRPTPRRNRGGLPCSTRPRRTTTSPAAGCSGRRAVRERACPAPRARPPGRRAGRASAGRRSRPCHRRPTGPAPRPARRRAAHARSPRPGPQGRRAPRGRRATHVGGGPAANRRQRAVRPTPPARAAADARRRRARRSRSAASARSRRTAAEVPGRRGAGPAVSEAAGHRSWLRRCAPHPVASDAIGAGRAPARGRRDGAPSGRA